MNDLTVLTKTPLFISGDCTRSARKIETVCGIARRAYFEHSSNLTTGRVAKFYNYLRDKYGSHAPSFIPRLHCYQCFENYTLYLYDYINQSTSHVFGRDVMCRLVDCLVRVNKEFYDVGDTSILLRRLRKRFSLSNLESFFENQLAAREAPYREEVKTLIPRLKSVFSDVMSLPKMFSHADLHGPSQEHSGNVIVSTSGDVFLIDWNRYGYAPLAFDLVAFFETMWNSNVFEEASDYYFDKSCPRMTLKQRRYTIALVMTAYSMLENVSLSRKWLEYAIRYG